MAGHCSPTQFRSEFLPSAINSLLINYSRHRHYRGLIVPRPFRTETAILNLKRYKSLGTDYRKTDLIHTADKTLRSEIYKFI
jgi:hypothetical protein